MTATPVFDLDPRDPAFVRDPYPFYAAMRGLGRVFAWPQLGHRCAARYDDVNALLRDRRFGRELLHVARREELGWPEPPAHLAAFHEFERHSLLALEPPRHTRLRGFVNAAFLDLVGRRNSEMMGMAWTTLVHPDDRDHVSFEWTHAIRDQRDFELRYRWVTRDGTVLHIKAVAKRLMDEHDTVLGWVGFATVLDVEATKI
jgi:PAS domain S-box-containing protein